MIKTSLARENWASKYQYKGETPLQTYQRVARALAEVEFNYGADAAQVELWYDRFLKTLVNFVPSQDASLETSYIDHDECVWDAIGLKCTTGGRITANAGTDYENATLLNCFINYGITGAKITYERQTPDGKYKIPVVMEGSASTPDDLTNIMVALTAQAKTLANEGGYGINFDFIRPRGSLIKGTGVRHPGIVAYMEVWDKMAEMIVRGDTDGYVDTLTDHLPQVEGMQDELEKAMPRKGAQMGCLSVWHPDIEEFVRAKQTEGKLTKFNISVLVDDAFMEAVEADAEYDLHFEGVVHKRIKARELYDLIMHSTFMRNEPGILFAGNMDRCNPISYMGCNNATNPCGEIGGNPYTTTVCLLGSVNVTQYVCADRTFDWDSYRKDLGTFARMLENVNDIGNVPLAEYEWALKNVRQYGMGLNGLGSAHYMLGLRYGSPESLEFTYKLGCIKENETWRASANLAAERGPAPAFDADEFFNTEFFTKYNVLDEDVKDLLRMHGARNLKTTTNPPLGNSSMMCDMVSNGIEPVFSHGYERTMIADRWPEGLTQENVREHLSEIEVGDAKAWRGEYAGRTYYYEPQNRGLCVIERVEDYGVAWLREHHPEDLKADYLVTAQDLPVDVHVDVQVEVQKTLNQSVSKCLVEGQIVETTTGPRAIEDFLEVEPDAEGFYPAREGLEVYGPDGNPVAVKQAYYGGVKPSYRIRTVAGDVVECSEAHRFRTREGWIRAEALSEGDFVHTQDMSYTHGDGGLALNFNVESLNLRYYKEVRIPTKMTPAFAELLGMIAADGHITRNSFGLTEKDPSVGPRFISLCEELFERTPGLYVDKRNDVRSHRIASTPLSALLKHCLKGTNAFDKAVPDAIMYGSLQEKLAFLSGVTLDGYFPKGRKAFYLCHVASEELAKGVQRLARQIWGNSVSRGQKITATGNYSHGVSTCRVEGLEPLEQHKLEILAEVQEGGSLVELLPDSLQGVHYASADPKYPSFNNLRQRSPVYVRQSTASKHELDYQTVIQIASVEFIGDRPVYDIEVDAEHHSYLVEGLISHNTANLPNDYPFVEFKDLYLNAWRRGLNGFTTYRAGTMESVLAVVDDSESEALLGGSTFVPTYGDLLATLRHTECTPEGAEITDEGVVVREVRLPDTFSNGMTQQVRREDSKFYFHLSYIPEDLLNPIAFWIHSNSYREGEYVTLNRAFRAVKRLLIEVGVDPLLVDAQANKLEEDAYHVRLGKIISMAMRHNVALPHIVNAMRDIEGDYISTTLTAVRKFLSEHIKDGAKAVGVSCPQCGSMNVVYESGCSTCRDCGHSGCGG
jgi:ribonucleoside-diphosphate reductase alpha chain